MQLAELVRGDEETASLVDEFLVLDCRYPYEYKGGHIPGAMNIWNKDTLQEKFFTGPEYTPSSKRRIIIFHCEFSSKRGPDMYVFHKPALRIDFTLLSLFSPLLFQVTFHEED